MDTDEGFLPVSALQHLVFCERQCALIHVERIWVENSLTLSGRHLHERTDRRGRLAELRDGVLTVRRLPIRSRHLRLAGVTDVVEFVRSAGADAETTVELPGRTGWWRIHPVEYKRGSPKRNRCDEVQVCAQAICLEEMFATSIINASIFYGLERRRHQVELSPGLRAATSAAAERLHALVSGGQTPAAQPGPKCRQCSLRSECLPETACESSAADRYVSRIIARELRNP